MSASYKYKMGLHKNELKMVRVWFHRKSLTIQTQ